MKIVIDCDANGTALKQVITGFLREKGIDCRDLEYLAFHPDHDYPDVAFNLALKIRAGEYDRGILICGTGLGMAMCANKVKGVYAGTCHDAYSAERLAKSNDAQVLCLGAQVVGPEAAKMIVGAWMVSQFQGGRSLPKVRRIRELEAESFSYFAALPAGG